MAHESQNRYRPAGDTVRQNRIAVKARALSRRRIERAETIAEILSYRSGILS